MEPRPRDGIDVTQDVLEHFGRAGRSETHLVELNQTDTYIGELVELNQSDTYLAELDELNTQVSWSDTIMDELSKLVRSSELVRPPDHPRSNTDIRSLFEAYLLNHDVSSRETTWRMCSTQIWNSSKKNQIKRSSDVGVMPFTNQVIFSSREFGLCGSSRVCPCPSQHGTARPE